MCTRITKTFITNNEKNQITGRNMDWKESLETKLWFFPKNVSRDGATDFNPYQWTSIYSSIVASAYDLATCDGINEKGLTVNTLWLNETIFPEASSVEKEKFCVSLSVWPQLFLDVCQNVKETIEIMKNIEVLSFEIPEKNNLKGTEHVSVSDADGNSAVFEYIDGKLIISSNINNKLVQNHYTSKEMEVMTNSPEFSQQQAINTYWSQQDGSQFLPGSAQSPDRFVRATYYSGNIPTGIKNDSESQLTKPEALGSILSVLNNASHPFEPQKDETKPDISQTIWRTLADQKDLKYYFQSTQSPFMVWVNLDELKSEEQILMLNISDRYSILEGNQNKNLQQAEPFEFYRASTFVRC